MGQYRRIWRYGVRRVCYLFFPLPFGGLSCPGGGPFGCGGAGNIILVGNKVGVGVAVGGAVGVSVGEGVASGNASCGMAIPCGPNPTQLGAVVGAGRTCRPPT